VLDGVVDVGGALQVDAYGEIPHCASPGRELAPLSSAVYSLLAVGVSVSASTIGRARGSGS
jgi:hypothetical protein